MNPASTFTVSQFLQFILPFVNIAVYLVVIVIALSCIWRVEKRFDRFLKLLTTALALVLFRLMVGVMGLSDDPNWLIMVRSFDLISGILLISAFVVLIRMLKGLNHEK